MDSGTRTKSSPYNTTPGINERRDSEDILSNSNTEVDESLLGFEDKQWLDRDDPASGHQSRGKRRNTWLSTIKRYLDTGLLLVILGMLSVLLLRDPSGRNGRGPQVGGDYKNIEPQFTTRTVKWESDMSFTPHNVSEFFTDQTLARWKSIMPSNAGRGPPGETFSTTSMTHQLHCIYMLARTYSATLTNQPSLLPPDYHAHFFHCIDYLRQAAMCSADLSLELHDVTDSDDLGAGDGGWSGKHVCKDYGEVIGYLEGQIKDGVRVVLPVDD